ncbi:MAG: hypothetical protein JNN28_02480 [Saprospiraceae bacterium]|nr:hypothetical protein [Saprospiraceae bacterium]
MTRIFRIAFGNFGNAKAEISNFPKQAAEGSIKIRVICVIRVPNQIRVICVIRVPKNSCHLRHPRSPKNPRSKIRVPCVPKRGMRIYFLIFATFAQ